MGRRDDARQPRAEVRPATLAERRFAEESAALVELGLGERYASLAPRHAGEAGPTAG